MRLPATLLGLLTWGLLSRCALPRLGVHKPWLAALAFATWWVPLCLGLRPEPWVAAGLLGCWLLVERAVATRRLLPLVLGLLLAGATTALTPGGLVAFTPFLAGARPLLRLLRTRPDLHRWPMVAALVAGPASAVLLMVYDQSFGAMLESTRVRSLVGGGAPWYEEAQRYSELLSDSFQGSIGRRAAVLVTLLAAAAVLMAVRRGPKRRMVVTLLLALAVMTFTPTKWTQHFGDLAGVGAAVLVLGAATARRTVGALAAAVVVGALVVAGLNNWPFVAAWFTPTVLDHPGPGRGHPAGDVAAGGGRGGRRPRGGAARCRCSWSCWSSPWRCSCSASPAARSSTATATPSPPTPSPPSAATPAGCSAPCRWRPIPRPGCFRARPPACPSTSEARPCPASSSTGRSPPTGSRCGATWSSSRPSAPCAWATTSSSSSQASTRSTKITTPNAVPLDVGVPVPRGATAVRLVVDAGPGGTAEVTLPRTPRLTPMEQVLPPGTRAILDWPVAFLFPCLVPEPLPPGVPQWRVAPPTSDPSAGITYAPGFGGPFAGPRLLVTQQRLPTYLAGDPTRDAIRLYRWIPITGLRTPQPVVTEHTVMGWTSDGHARVPGLDPVG